MSQRLSERNAPFFASGEKILLDQNGVWRSDGTEITHEGTRRLFARSLKKDESGYYLQIGPEIMRVEIEDTPYFVQRIEGYPETGFQLVINDERHEELNPLTLHYHPGRLTCRLTDGSEAKFLHSAYFDLLRELQEDDTTYFLVINGHRIELALKSDTRGLHSV